VNNTLNQHHHQQNQKFCHHRRAGKCNRFPCPSLHRELPAPPPHASVNGGGGARRGFTGKDSSSFSGRWGSNSNYCNSWGHFGNKGHIIWVKREL
jgi:hypothetical protein